ncbi:TdeIII family type II restriction endonuclease [Cronobacter sakazakii]|uniref:TdeIII family type II restriction endonuclease n=1 Tax=Cronobacter sakazakii TaxID=28141 RepID=UPI00164D508D|nr:TdeIII family type II restriction endonuclease [Cronobacter sakazakii]
MDRNCYHKVQQEFISCVERTLRRLQQEATVMPFHSALLSKEAVFWSRFERSFSTSFGQSVIERISAYIAESSGAADVQTQKVTFVHLDHNQLMKIEHHISQLRLRGSGAIPNWNEDYNNLLQTALSGNTDEVRVISDLYYFRNGRYNYFSIKTVKPNIDQTAEAKRDLLKLKINDPNCNAYFGLYYNPFGEERELYNWTPPMRLFNFHTDPCILIGRDYWDTIGGEGTYETVLEIASSVSADLQEQIRQYGIDNFI